MNDQSDLSQVDAVATSRILVVDDDALVREWLALTLTGYGYEVMQAASGREAIRRVAEINPDLILLDVLMPGLDGFEVTRQLKRNPVTAGIPVMLVTALEDRSSRIQGLQVGADEFLSKPVDPPELIARVRNLLRVKHAADELAQRNLTLEQEVLRKTSEVREHCIDTVLALMRAAEYRDEVTGTHVARISRYTTVLCHQLGMDRTFREQIFYASPMHDIGKLAIPDNILTKAGRLNEPEWDVMKTHTLLGKEILEGSHSPYLQMGADIALHHHECWDGSGYPYGLRGEEIPLAARIMAVCDVYDALRSQRPYKPALVHDVALRVMREGDARTDPAQFDPDVLAALFASADQFGAIYQQSLPA